MKVYLAASYNRKAEVQLYRHMLMSVGVMVTSSWLDTSDEEEQVFSTLKLENDLIEASRKYLERDLQDIRDCDALVVFIGDSNPRGGKHVEYGYALALNKALYVVGPTKAWNLFHTHFSAFRVLTIEQLISLLVLHKGNYPIEIN